MTPNDWNAILAPDVPWQSAYGAVARMARLHLEANVLLEAPVTTAQLVEALYPEREALGPAGQLARARMFKALPALATHDLAGYCSRAEARPNKMKKMIRPWLWHPLGMPAERKVGKSPLLAAPYGRSQKIVRAAELLHSECAWFIQNVPAGPARDAILRVFEEVRQD